MRSHGYTPSPEVHFDPRIVPPPPRLHWGWVLAISVLTRSLFNSIWLIVQAVWIRRVTGRGDVLWLAIANVAIYPVIFVGAVLLGVTMAMVPGASHRDHSTATIMATALIVLLVLTIYSVTVFRLKSALESPQIGLTLSGIMTFFFSAIYFQYFLHDYVMQTAEEMYGRLPDPPPYVPPTSTGPLA